MADALSVTLGVPVSAASGNITFLYPPGRSANDYYQSLGAVLAARDLQNTYLQGVDFTLAYGEGQVVLTIISALVLPAANASGQTPPTGIVSLQLPLNIDAALAMPSPARGGDQYIFT